jgi:hypothetical protein
MNSIIYTVETKRVRILKGLLPVVKEYLAFRNELQTLELVTDNKKTGFKQVYQQLLISLHVLNQIVG